MLTRALACQLNSYVNCLYAYNGWNMLNLAAAEVYNPSKTIPWAIQLGIITATVSFVWINVSYVITHWSLPRVLRDRDRERKKRRLVAMLLPVCGAGVHQLHAFPHVMGHDTVSS